jgi:hypothetical protein
MPQSTATPMPDNGAPAPTPAESHTVAGGITVQLPATETADHGQWATRQDQCWDDAAAFTVTVQVLDSTTARPVWVQFHNASISCLLDLPREQARRLGLALLAAVDYDTPGR